MIGNTSLLWKKPLSAVHTMYNVTTAAAGTHFARYSPACFASLWLPGWSLWGSLDFGVATFLIYQAFLDLYSHL